MTLSDPIGTKRLGPIGPSLEHGRGLEVMTAMALLPDGTPVGPCGQAWWAPPTKAKKKLSKKAREKLPVADKETRDWLDVMAEARELFACEAPKTRLWFQLDRHGEPAAPTSPPATNLLVPATPG